MKKKELKVVTVTYCDYCGKELKYGHASIEYKDGRVMDFCNEYTSKINKTCLDKHKEIHKEENNLIINKFKNHYYLSNQDEIKDRCGEEFLELLLVSLKAYFNNNVEITEYDYPDEKFKIIHVPNAQPNTDSTFEFYINFRYNNIYDLDYKSCFG
jgi:ribosomal protein L24E